MKKAGHIAGRKSLEQIIAENQQGIRIDLGGGGNPQPGFVNIDIRDLPQVDVVHNIEQFPWPFPDECASLVMASHLIEHINPSPPDARLAPLIKLLLKKGVVTEKEIKDFIGDIEPGPIFIRLMDEIWRILKPGGQFMIALPYAGSPGYWQDPSHVNGCNEATWAYFDPLEAGGHLYKIYKPKPWKIQSSTWQLTGNAEIVLQKRIMDKSYLL